MLLGLDKKILSIGLKIVDETIGKKFPIIDKITDQFQENETKLKELDDRIKKLEDKPPIRYG